MTKNDDRDISVGVVIEDLMANQKSIEFISQANDFLSKDADIDLCVFTLNVAPPAIKPNFPVLHSRDLFNFQDIIVATSLGTLQAAVQSNASDIFHYIYYPEFLSQNAIYKHDQLQKWFTRKNVTRFARSLDYVDVLREEFNCDILEEVLPSFKLEDLMHIIKEHMS